MQKKEQIRTENQRQKLENQQEREECQIQIEKQNQQIVCHNEHQQKQIVEGMSKKQRKKLIKKQIWEKQKLVRRQQQRQKQKLKKKLKRQQQRQQKQKQQMGQLQKVQKGKKENHMLMLKRKQDYGLKMRQGVRVVVDLQFYDKMTQKEQNSLIKQLAYCHSVNRKAQRPFNYIITSATPQRQQILANHYNADKWGITIVQPDIIQQFGVQQLVYLTGDAQEQIQQFEQGCVYVIGGIVDHNRMKRITVNYALQNKIRARRLPMKGVQLKASVHLAVNHVWEWMLSKYNGMSWEQAIKSVIPLRKREEDINQQKQQIANIEKQEKEEKAQI